MKLNEFWASPRRLGKQIAHIASVDHLRLRDCANGAILDNHDSAGIG